jgi:hypothetical protein
MPVGRAICDAVCDVAAMNVSRADTASHLGAAMLNTGDTADRGRYCAVVEVAELEEMLDAWRAGDTSGLYAMFVRTLEHVDCDAALGALPGDARGHLVERLQARDGEFAMAIADASPRARARIRAWNDLQGVRAYQSVVPYVNRDDLHEVLAARGPNLLAQDVPYIIQACRWKHIDRTRRRLREEQLLEHNELAIVEDAFEVLVSDDRLVQLRIGLARLSDIDVMIVWKTAEGDDDHTIARRLRVSVDVVRQRRSRAVGRLREFIRKSEEESEG